MNICRTPSPSGIIGRLVNPLIVVAISIWLLYIGREVLIPLAFSALLAMMLIAPCRFLERRGFPRGIAAIVCMLLSLFVFLIVFYFLSNSIISFRSELPQMIENINSSVVQLESWAKDKFHISTSKMQELVKSSTSDVLPKTSYILNTALTTVSSFIFITILVFIQSFLFLLYRGLIVHFFTRLFAEEYSERIRSVFTKLRYVIRSYVGGLMIEMVIVAVAYCSVLFILGVKYALLLGIIGAILNIIPYLGIFMACILSTLITFTTNSPTTVIWVIISLIIIHMIDSNILMPRIVGSKVKINAMTTIIGVVIGSALWGIPGTFMAVPFMAMMKVIFEEVSSLQPFALVMGDDVTAPEPKPVLHKLREKAGKMRKKKS